MNNLITQIAHAEEPPLRIEREFLDGREFVRIEGVLYEADYFREFAQPNVDVLYAIRRDDEGAVGMFLIENAAAAEAFFEEVLNG